MSAASGFERSSNGSSPSEPTGIAIVGCGYWGRNYVRIFSELPDARVLVLCDSDPERLEEVGSRYPGVHLTMHLEDALAVPGVDAVVVATAAETHYEIAGACLVAGKHLLVEKPLTTSIGDADELVALAEQSERILLVGHTFLYNPGVRVLKEYLTRAELGDIYYLYARRTNLGPIRNDVTAVWDLASHDVAIFSYLLDAQPEWVSAVGARVLRAGREDVGFITLGYPNGVVAHVHASWADPHKVREVVIVGSERRVVFDDLDPRERVRVFSKGVGRSAVSGFDGDEPEFEMRDGAIVSPVVAAIEPLRAQSGHFLHCIRRGETPLSDGRLGRDVVRVMEAIDRSIAAHGAPAATGGSNGRRPVDGPGWDEARALANGGVAAAVPNPAPDSRDA